MRRRSQFIVFALASLLGVTACTGAPEPDAPGPPEPIVTADVEVDPPGDPAETDAPPDDVPSPEPLPLPEYPADLTAEDTAENAVRAAEYFVELMNYAQSNGETANFEDRSLAQCKACGRFVELQIERYSTGGFLVGNTIELMDAQARRSESGRAWEVFSTWNISEGLKKEHRDAETEIIDAREEQMRLGVSLLDNKWMLVEIAFA